MKNKDVFLALGLIGVGFIYRLIPNHPPNFTPIAAMALVGGLYMNKKLLALAAPLIALYLGDLILNNTINRPFFSEQAGFVFWADYMLYTYVAIALTVVLGMLLVRKKTAMKILLGGVVSSIAFFIITNFGSWLSLPMYPKTGAGLLLCFEAAIPFFRNTLISNVLFITLFVGAIEFFRNFSFSAKQASLGK